MTVWSSHFLEFHSLVEPILRKSLHGHWTHMTSGVKHPLMYCSDTVDKSTCSSGWKLLGRGTLVANSSFLPNIWPYYTKYLQILAISLYKAEHPCSCLGSSRWWPHRYPISGPRQSVVAESAVPVFRRRKQEDCCYFEASSVYYIPGQPGLHIPEDRFSGTQEPEAGRSLEFEASLVYIVSSRSVSYTLRPHLKTIIRKKVFKKICSIFSNLTKCRL